MFPRESRILGKYTRLAVAEARVSRLDSLGSGIHYLVLPLLNNRYTKNKKLILEQLDYY
jgi:hypothetical protein